MTREEKENLLREAVDILIRLDNHLMTSRENAEFSAWVEELMNNNCCEKREQNLVIKQVSVLDKIRAEIDSYCSENRDRNDGLYIAMRIIDKYKVESENQ